MKSAIAVAILSLVSAQASGQTAWRLATNAELSIGLYRLTR
jgi:hypothetical protein